MFTGFVQDLGIVQKVNPIDSGAELIIGVSCQFATDIQIQSNISIDGSVLTVLHKDVHNSFSVLKFYASKMSKISSYVPKKRVNLERAVRLGEEVPGTFFYGLPSGQVSITSIEKMPNGKLMIGVSFEDKLMQYLSINDQVCLDGVLLQIKDIVDGLMVFEIYPKTLDMTNLGDRQVGDTLRIEIDPVIVKISRVFEKLRPVF